MNKVRSTANTFLNNKRFRSKRLKLRPLQQRQQLQQLIRQQKMWQIGEKEFHHLDTFHSAINTSIFFSHFFGLMPLRNTLQPNPNKVTFHLKSAAMLGTGLFLTFGNLKLLYVAKNIFESGINMKNIVGLIYHTVTMTTFILFLSLARCWPKILKFWTRVEMIFFMPPYEKPRWSLRLKLKVVCWCFCVAALVEHIMFYASDYYTYRMKVLLCSSNHSKISFRDYLIDQQFKTNFNVVPFNIFTAFGVIFLNTSFTYIWNYMDLFIMLVGVSLTTRFQQFSARLKKLEGLWVSDSVWHDVRRHHIQLCELVDFVDEYLSPIVLLTALNNMYFICNQLLIIFTKLRWPINHVYFWFSLIFLISRTASAFLCASAVHDASMEPLRVLYSVPGGLWTEEVQRFMFQLTSQCVALTGQRLYSLTRKNLFGYFSTIATYELVLLQLDRDNLNAGLPNLCD